MKYERDKGSLHRLPTRAERIIGIIASAIMVLIFGAASFFLIRSSLFSADGKDIVVLLAIAVVFLVISLWLFYRILLGRAAKPSLRTVRLIGYIFVAVGCVMIFGGLLTDMRNPFYVIGIGLVSLSVGIRNIATHRSSRE